MAKRILLIINPKAGKGRYQAEIAHILDVLCLSGAAVTVQMTNHSGHAREIAAKEGSRFDVIACMGGDGTLGETIAGLMALKTRPPVGYIPMGTTNDMATTLELSRDPMQAAKDILHGKLVPLDVGRFENEYFTYIAAFGAFTEVSYQTPRESKQTLGHFAYVLEGMARLTKIVPRKLVVEYDETGRIEGDFIFGAVTNTTSIAGLWKLKSDLVDLADGAFEVILIKNPKNILDINAIFMDIVTKKTASEYVQIFSAKQVRFLFEEPVPWTRDGEAGGTHTAVNLHNIHSAVQIYVPDEGE